MHLPIKWTDGNRRSFDERSLAEILTVDARTAWCRDRLLPAAAVAPIDLLQDAKCRHGRARPEETLVGEPRGAAQALDGGRSNPQPCSPENHSSRQLGLDQPQSMNTTLTCFIV